MGDVTSGGVQDDAAANADISGGGGGSSSNYSYSDLGQSPGAMGGRGPSFGGGDRTPPSPTEINVPNVSPPSTSFQLGFGPTNPFAEGLASLTGSGAGDGPSFGAQESPGYQPDPTTYANVPESINQTRIRDLYRQDSPSLGGAVFGSPEQRMYGSGRMFPANVGFTSPSAPTVEDSPQVDATMAALQRGAPALMASNAAEEAVQTAVAQPKFMFDYGFGDAGSPQIDDRPRPDPNEIKNKGIIAPLRTVPAGGGDPLLFQDSRIMGMSPGAMGGSTIGPIQGPLPTDIDPTSDAAMFANLTSRPSGALAEVALPAGRPSDAVMLAAAAKNPTSQRDFSFREFLGNIFKNLGSKAKSVGAFISGLSAEKLQEYAEQFLAGGANQKASTVGMDPFAQQGMGPGPAVGGGAPSPSGGGGMAMPAKDPCPPGFRFDPTLQQCVPIIAPNTPTDTTTPPPAPTPPAPTPPAAGGIANAYPFVLTPPIGAPVGNLPPVRLTT